jgi:xanthine dehydrogenase molybdopterin-binding subunit B
VGHTDVPGSNQLTGQLADEEVFASSIVQCVGAVIGLVVGETEEAAQTAANLIRIEYELLSPTILNIEDAIAHQSYHGDEACLRLGDIDQSLAEAEHTLEGEFHIGGQEHFYMETNVCMVIPSSDDKEVTLHLATQSPTTAQEMAAAVLARDVSRITCHTKRIGGAFGGKESRA